MSNLNLQKARFVVAMAKRDILQEKKISIIVTVMLGFAFLNLVFFPGFIGGLSRTFTEGIIDGETGHLVVEPEKGPIENADTVEEKIKRLENVETTEKIISVSGEASYKGKTSKVRIRGSSAYEYRGYTEKMVRGDFLKKDSDSIVVGRFLTEDKAIGLVNGLEVDKGRIITLRNRNFSKEYKIRGIIGTPGSIGGLSEIVLMPYGETAQITGKEGKADKIRVIMDDRDDSDQLKRDLQALNIKYEVKTWKEQSNLADAVKSTFSITTQIISVIGLIVALAAIGVVIYINTKKRVREMGIVRAIGGRKTLVIYIFVLEASIFGVLGIILGNGLALAIDSFLAAKPVPSPLGPITSQITTQLLVERSALMVLASVVAGVIPSYQVSKTDIVSTIEKR